MNCNNLSFRERITELRREKGLTKEQLASAINFGKSIVYYWESGEREPNTKALIALSAFFNVSIEYLLGLNDEEKSLNTSKSSLSQKEQRLLKAFISLDENIQEKLIEDAEWHAKQAHKTNFSKHVINNQKR